RSPPLPSPRCVFCGLRAGPQAPSHLRNPSAKASTSLFEEKSRSTTTYNEPNVWLTKEDIEHLRRTITYSEWPDNYNKGKEVMKILFDENGIAKQIFLHGKEVKAED
ncbi:MAG: hypothetical protein HQ592_09685, partial [Planctomycetes bacterium]|nr:hypothetical protein [Planctomycetota bacterium]